MTRLGLHAKYGGYALITGAARGIGRAFAELLAAEGFGLLLVDKLEDENEALGRELRAAHGIDAKALSLDLCSDALEAQARRWCEAYDIGLLVNNAGVSPMGRFLDIPLDTHVQTLDLNCRATLILSHVLGRSMVARGRGALLIISSESAITGAPYFSHYAATKGHGLNLACGLWEELRDQRIDVLGVCPGLTNTAPMRALGLDETHPAIVPVNEPRTVARGALRALGKRPATVPTLLDSLSAGLMSRMLPRSWTLSLMGRSLRKMAPGDRD